MAENTPAPQAAPQDKNTPTKTTTASDAAGEAGKGRFRARVHSGWTSWDLGGDLVLTEDWVEVSFDQAATIQELAERDGVPYIIEEVKE